MTKAKFVPYRDFLELPEADMRSRAEAFRVTMARRRSIRQFSTRAVDRSVIEECVRAAHSSPSGANMQPWHFVVVSDPSVKAEIRRGAEDEEREFYSGRAGEHWIKALEPIGTVPLKPFLDTAPYLIVVFQKNYAISSNHQRLNHYYVPESVGIAVGILISGLQHAGLSTLIHTPRPMGFLRRILKRPANERTCMIVVTGYPAPDATVPVLKKKAFEDTITFF
ncbi:MAG: nitroreductase family protein [Rhodospirillaceae bacterium]|nr:nitroreductase family protein [Rhodospirillaceae bacterium]